jgi:hypothetical protein
MARQSISEILSAMPVLMKKRLEQTRSSPRSGVYLGLGGTPTSDFGF